MTEETMTEEKNTETMTETICKDILKKAITDCFGNICFPYLLLDVTNKEQHIQRIELFKNAFNLFSLEHDGFF